MVIEYKPNNFQGDGLMTTKQDIRLLAAVMFADMVGYTKLMQQDEQQAKLLRDRQRKVVDEKILEFHGQVMQYYGDGTLSMFGSAIDAVNAAIKIQKELNKNEPKVPLRIGIHLGDVVYDDEGIYGDAVNLAARVQGLGTPGSVMISGKVFDEIRNHPGIRVEAFGEHELKNVFQSTSIFALANSGLDIPPQRHVQELTGSYQHSVAVLPFANFSSDPDNEYFSDGITEEIINLLAQIKGLEVASRTSVFAYKSTIKDVRVIAKELNVATVLEGSVRKAGNRIRVTAQLINSSDGFHLWSENFDGELTDIFEMQDEIAKKIADKLAMDEFFDRNKPQNSAKPQNLEAYNKYLKGKHYWNKGTPEAIKKAIEHLEEAIALCDTYANAYSALAGCYTFLGATGILPSNEAYIKAEEYASKAVELNSNNADSYVALGLVNLFFKWNFDQAEAYLKKAITIEPDNSDARIGMAYVYRVLNNYEKAVHNLKAAVKIDPLDLNAKIQLAGAYNVGKEHEKSLKLYNDVMELDASYRAAYEGKALAYTYLGKFEEARKEAAKYLELINEPHGGGTFLGYMASLMGNKSGIEENLDRLKRRSQERPDVDMSLDFACLYSCLGDNDKAFECLNESLDKHLGAMVFFDSMLPLHTLKDDPRYEEIRQHIGLPEKVFA